ncbi:MAG: hypothetical protein M3R45_04685 [Pseudomonadota bacterium]|nr:hypothetical protein [Pseudomonadota bacterium]
MFISFANSMQGNKAVASVLLLYYHLLQEGGVTHEQTVYLDPDDFDAFEYLKVEVASENLSIDQGLLRRGAVIALLCELNDMVTDYEDDYLSQPFTQKILAALGPEAIAVVPEVESIIEAVSKNEDSEHYSLFNQLLRQIFEKYVFREIKALVSGNA